MITERRRCAALREHVLRAEIFVREGVWSPRRAGKELLTVGCPLPVAVRTVGRAAFKQGSMQ